VVSCGPTSIRSECGTTKTIVETAIESGSFNTLVALLKAADLVDLLGAEEPFTVFAPTDDAFDHLPEGTLPNLLKNKEWLTTVLSYHVVGGRYDAADLASRESVDTLAKKSLAIDSSQGVKVNGSQVIKPDVQCSNGLIHTIDGVLIPE